MLVSISSFHFPFATAAQSSCLFSSSSAVNGGAESTLERRLVIQWLSENQRPTAQPSPQLLFVAIPLVKLLVRLLPTNHVPRSPV